MSSISVQPQWLSVIVRSAVTFALVTALSAVIRHDHEKVKDALLPDLKRAGKAVDPEKVKLRAAMTSLDTYRPDSFDILFKITEMPPEERTFALREHVDYYEKIIRYRPYQMEAYVLLGFCYYQEGRAEDAIRSYERAIALSPSFFWPYYNLGAIYFNQRNYVAAAQYFKRAAQLDARETLQTIFRSRIYLEILSREKATPDIIQKNLAECYHKIYEALVLCEYYLKQGAGKPPQPLPIRFL